MPTSKLGIPHPETTLSSECRLSGADPSTSPLRLGLSGEVSCVALVAEAATERRKRTSGERAGLHGVVPAIRGHPGMETAGGLGGSGSRQARLPLC